MSVTLVYLITSALCVLSTARLFRYGAETKPPFLKEAAAYVAYQAVVDTCFLLFRIPMLNMALNLTGFFLLNRLYEKSVKRNIMMVLVTYVAMILAELAAVWVSGFVPNSLLERQQDSLSQMAMIIQCVIVSLIVQVLKRFKGLARSTEGDWISWAGVILLQIMLIGLISIITFNYHGDVLVIAVLMLAVIDYVVIYIYDRLILSEKERVKNLLLAEQKESYEREVEILKDSQKKIRGIYHDIKNHILILRSYAEQEQYTELNDYLGRLQEETRAAAPQVYTGQPAVDSMLHYKISSAKDIPIQVETSIPEQLKIDDFDITVILGNLLDNAIEACEKLEKEKRRILVSMKLVKNQLLIRMENPYAGLLRRQGERLLTLKADRGSHGIGLENVRRIVEKYHGLMETETEDQVFRTKIMLYLG